MRYSNPIIKGFYPDPSVCAANGKYYLVCSSFQYFPGVPLFESKDLVNWKQIGNVLTRKEQVQLEKINSSGGVFAPTIRYHEGRFYMVTTNDTTRCNFYVYTDDIYGEWSDPIVVDQGGIDPSLLFDEGHVYFISNGTDDFGVSGVCQSEINIETGEKLTKTKCIWQGSGGRYLESPHMYKIFGDYYLMAAEGGTEYGHMITYARAKNPWGPFENYAKNPVLTNRNKAPEIIQGIGHGDLVCDPYGDWHIISLGFRQIHEWQPYHHLGREVFMTPVTFDEAGWFTAGTDGTTDWEYEIKGDFSQEEKRLYTFENTELWPEWMYLRHPHMENYEVKGESDTPDSSKTLKLIGTNVTLDDCDSPTFIGLRQRDFDMEMSCDVNLLQGEGGITVYMCENEHYDICLKQKEDGVYAVLKLNIGNIKHTEKELKLASNKAKLLIQSDSLTYHFFVLENDVKTELGVGLAKYLSSEVSSGFTGVMLGLFAVEGSSEFTALRIQY